MHLHLVIQLGLAVACLIVFFAFGAIVGYQAAATHQKRTNPVRPSVPATFMVPADFYEALSAQLLTRIQVLSATALKHRTALPSSFWHAIEELAQAVEELRQRIGRVTKRAVDSVPAGFIDSQFATKDSTDFRRSARSLMLAGIQSPTTEQPCTRLSGCEFQQLTVDEGEPDNCHQKLSKTRRKYDARQVIYRCYETEDGRTLAPASTVRCHDLGVEGISFFWPQCPDFESLVVALGTEEKPAYLVAEVMNSKAVVMHNEACYLVGCQFKRRLARFNDAVAPKAYGRDLIGSVASGVALASEPASPA